MKQLIHALQGTTSKDCKIMVLAGFNSELSKKTLRYTYDPYKSYGIGKYEDIDFASIQQPDDTMFDILDRLANRKLSGHKARYEVETFAEWNGDLIKLVVSKDLKCGIAATTINKVFSGLIPQFKIQKAKEVPLDKVEFPTLIQVKYDGARVIITKHLDGTVTFLSSSGKYIHLPKLSASLADLGRSLSPFVLDTEVVFGDGKLLDRSNVCGVINSAIHAGIVNESTLNFFAFDALTIEEFSTSTCRRQYKDRLKQLYFILKALQHEQLRPAPTFEVPTARDADNLYNTLIDQGFEGCMLKTETHKYTFKRSKDWVKMKETKTVDLEVVDIVLGEGKYLNMIGALRCSGILEGKVIHVNVGSGLTDAERDLAFDHFLYKIVEVKYNSITRDSVTGDYSLFLPRYSRLRTDKDNSDN